MRRRVVQLLALIMGAGNNAPVQGNNYGADRHLVFIRCLPGFFQGHFHVRDMKGVTGIIQG